LEVRNRSDGHPPFTEREREIHLNGIGGVKFLKPGSKFDPGFFVIRYIGESRITTLRSHIASTLVIPNEVRDLTIEAEVTQSILCDPGSSGRSFASLRMTFVVERWALSVERWAFRADESYTRP
jgi:hypothetical protein